MQKLNGFCHAGRLMSWAPNKAKENGVSSSKAQDTSHNQAFCDLSNTRERPVLTLTSVSDTELR